MTRGRGLLHTVNITTYELQLLIISLRYLQKGDQLPADDLEAVRYLLEVLIGVSKNETCTIISPKH